MTETNDEWESGRWITEEWRPQQPSVTKTRRTTCTCTRRRRRATTRNWRPSKEEEDSDSIEDIWEKRNRFENDSIEEGPSFVEEKYDEDEKPADSEAFEWDEDDDASLSLETEEEQEATVCATPNKPQLAINKADNEHQDPTESTVAYSSGTASSQSSVHNKASIKQPQVSEEEKDELDIIQKQLDAIDRQLRKNQIQLEESQRLNNESSSAEKSSVLLEEPSSDQDNDSDDTRARLPNNSQKRHLENGEETQAAESGAESKHPKNLYTDDRTRSFVAKMQQKTSILDALDLYTTTRRTRRRLSLPLAASESESDKTENLSTLTNDSIQSTTDSGSEVPPRNKKQLQRKQRRRKTASDTTRKTDGGTLISALLDTVIATSDEWNQKSMMEMSFFMEDAREEENKLPDTFAQRVVQQLERTLDLMVQLVDGLEILLSFGGSSTVQEIQSTTDSIDHNYAPLLKFLWDYQLQSPLKQYLTEEPEDSMLTDQLYRVALVLKGLSTQFKEIFLVQKRPFTDLETDGNVKANFVTLFELLRREVWGVTLLTDSTNLPKDKLTEFMPSIMLQLAWGVDTDSSVWTDLFPDESDDNLWEEEMQRFRRLCCRWLIQTLRSTGLLGPLFIEVLREYSEDAETEAEESDSSSEASGTTHQQASCEMLPQIAPTEDTSAWLPATRKIEGADAARAILDSIEGDPLCRVYFFEDILSRLFPEDSLSANDPNVVSLCGPTCIGKTTLAAMVGCTPLVHEWYPDGIAWIGLHNHPKEKLPYDKSISYLLHNLLDQLDLIKGADNNLLLNFPEYMHVPGETADEQTRREIHLMTAAKRQVSDILQNRRVLIIVDNIKSQQELELFDFVTAPNALLVTSRCSNLLAKTKIVHVGFLADEEEALQLLAEECCMGEEFWDASSSGNDPEEARSLALKCCFHPMAMKMLGRFLHLQGKQTGMKGNLSIAPTNRILASYRPDESMEMVFDILNMSLSSSCGGAVTRIFNMSLIAFVKVFYSDDFMSYDHCGMPNFRKGVPLDVVELLFESLLVYEEETLQEGSHLIYRQKGKAAELILDVLCNLGILVHSSCSQRVNLAHSIHKEYVDSLLDTDAEMTEFANEENQAMWHRFMASNISICQDSWNISQFEYVLEMLPHHMICGKMYMEAVDLIANRSFVRARIDKMRLTQAAQQHIKDIDNLLCAIVPESIEERLHSRQFYHALINQAYFGLVDAVMDEEITASPSELAEALIDLGTSCSRWSCWDEAISLWTKSLSLPALPIRTVSAVLFRVGAAYAEMGDYLPSLRSLNKCLDIREGLYDTKSVLFAETLRKVDYVYRKMNFPGACNPYYERDRIDSELATREEKRGHARCD